MRIRQKQYFLLLNLKGIIREIYGELSIINMRKLHIKYGDMQIKEYFKVKYVGILLDETMSGEAMAFNVVNKMNDRMKLLYRKNSFLTPALRCLLCKASI